MGEKNYICGAFGFLMDNFNTIAANDV